MSTEIIVNTDEIKATATGFLARSAQVRDVVASLITEHPAAAAAAMIAGQFAIEDAMTAADKAFIQKCVARNKILCEGASSKPPIDAVYAVIAEAESKQLDFGSAQYSVWGRGSFYAKEGAYRKWFRLRKDCSHLDVNPGLPEWKVLKDKSMWVVPGDASVAVSGEVVRIECVVGINGSAADIIANIEAKATRALLKRLWSKVSSIAMDESEDQIIEDREAAAHLPYTEKGDAVIVEGSKLIAKVTTGIAEQLRQQVEAAKTETDFDNMSVEIRKAKSGGELHQDEFNFLKSMVITARERLKA